MDIDLHPRFCNPFAIPSGPISPIAGLFGHLVVVVAVRVGEGERWRGGGLRAAVQVAQGLGAAHMYRLAVSGRFTLRGTLCHICCLILIREKAIIGIL